MKKKTPAYTKYIFFLLLSLYLCACSNKIIDKGPDRTLEALNTDSIVWMKKITPPDTVLMDAAAINNFVQKFNSAQSTGPCKYVTRQQVWVKMKNGSERHFRINQNTIKENNDDCSTANTSFFAE